MTLRILRSIYHFTVYVIGVVVLVAAVSVTMVRLVLPDIGIYRGEVEAWVSRYMGFPVVIRSMNATWYGWIPYLHLTNIDLLNKAETQTITHFESAEISIDPIASLFSRRIIPKHLTISGFELSVAHLSNGAIYIEGIDVADTDNPRPGKSELAEWLFKQEKIEIQNATVEWIDVKFQQEPVLLSDVSLKLRSDGERLQIDGSTSLPARYGKRMDFAFDAFGDLLTSNWSGELYMHARDINPDNWYSNYRPAGLNIAGGSANIRVWSTWKQARLTQLDGELQYDDFAALFGESRLRIDQLAYRFHGQRTDAGGWRFNMNLHDLLTENGTWPDANIAVAAEPVGSSGKYRYEASFDFLKLDDLTPIMSYLSFMPESARAFLADRRINGALRNGNVVVDPSAPADRQIRYDMNLENFSTNVGRNLPGISGTSAHVSGTMNEGDVEFSDQPADLHLPGVEMGNLHLAHIDGTVHWQRDAGAWTASSSGLYADSADIGARFTGSISHGPDSDSPFVNIVASVNHADMERLAPYIPRTEKFRLRDWVGRAVAGGQLVSADAVFRGRLSDFPFDDNSGKFQALISVADGTLDYSDYWPPVDRLNVEIFLDGKRMTANILGGKIFGADISSAVAGMEDYRPHEKMLTLAGHVTGDTHDLDLFVAQSPLGKDPVMDRLGKALTGGGMELDLDMDIPIRLPGHAPRVDGELRLSDASLRSELKGLALSKLNGTISFSREHAEGRSLTGRFLGQPVEVEVSGTKHDPASPPQIRISGNADVAFISDRLHEYISGASTFRDELLNRLSGNTDWKFIYTLGTGEGPDRQARRIEISSDLLGLGVDLPPPLGKPAHTVIPFSLERTISDTGLSDITMHYRTLGAILGMDPADPRELQRVTLGFGDREFDPSPNPGLTMVGHIDELAASEWWPIFSHHPASGDASILQKGMNVTLDVGALSLFEHRFKDVRVAARDTIAGWQLNLDGPEIAGQVELPIGLGRDAPVKIQMDRLYLAADAAPSDVRERVDPRRLPAAEISIADLRYGERELGAMNLRSTPIKEGLSIDQFEFTKPDLTLHGNGNWLHSNDSELSDFKVKLHAANIETMLDTFGYNLAAVRKGETDLEIDAIWPGAPMDFKLENLSGSLTLGIKKGQLLDVEPKAGRLFGLLSIQSLPRRLSLDFTDLFGKGMAFDTIDGSFQIANGQAYTNDLHLSGPSADVVITGRTGLADQDYDQLVTVTPQIADSLPVAGALFGPVGIGVGAVLYLAGEMFGTLHGIDNMLSYQYTITGSWNNPVIEKYKVAEEASG